MYLGWDHIKKRSYAWVESIVFFFGVHMSKIKTTCVQGVLKFMKNNIRRDGRYISLELCNKKTLTFGRGLKVFFLGVGVMRGV